MNSLTPLAANFTLWSPPEGRTVQSGAESIDFLLPAIPLPIQTSDLVTGSPTDNVIGSSIYDYLRQFPDCPYSSEYAVLLRDVWPHYISDLSAMILMLDHKEVDAPYVRRKITGMQILLLLNPDNPGLLIQLGISYYDLALNFVELNNCRSHLTKAINYFSAADMIVQNDPKCLSYLAQIDYLVGDYPKSIERLHHLSQQINDDETKLTIFARIEVLKGLDIPVEPLLADLESIGEAMQLLASGHPDRANMILERLEMEQVVTIEFPNPEFFSLLAISRERIGDPSGAQAAFAMALELEPSHQESLDGIDRLLKGGR